ncbi:hypothetical protein GGR56DRAFT_221999 [Xylariaceae sp. FL0804]|nr:hypothetical protein GGR56DRAFT_221999 [Xylariaceae sp. FL0804]
MMPHNQAQDLFNVDGMVAVVTGGGTGLGLYAARALDANGAACVYVVGRRREALEAAARTAARGRIVPLVGDVTSKASLAAVADVVRREHGFVNLFFANAGVSGPRVADHLPKRGEKEEKKPPTVREYQEALWHPEMDDFTRALHVNVTGAFYSVVAFLDLLDAGTRRRNVPSDAQILLTSSVAGFSRNLASSFAYSASKAAITHVGKMLSTLSAQNHFRIRCNTVIPGIYPSEMTEGIMRGLGPYHAGSGAGHHEHEKYLTDARGVAADRAPAERSGSEEDFAGAILFLASRAGAYVNGECLVTDGGRLAQLPGTY